VKILVTGAAGFLGSHISERLIELGHQVSGIDNLVGGYLENLPKGITFYERDLLSYSSLEECFQTQDMVVHAACTAYEGLSVFSPAYVTSNTFQITANALSWSIKTGVKKFIFLSSMARYGSQENYPFREEMIPNPQDPYGIAKLAAEKLVENLCTTHGLDFVILVPHNIIGPRQKFDDPYRNVASIMINRMLQNKPPIIYGDGEQIRCFSFVSDVVNPLVESCFNPRASRNIINIGPDENPITINELARLLSELLNFSEKPIYVKDRPQEVKFATCSADLARQILGYKTTVDINIGLKQLIDYIKEAGPKQFEYAMPLEILSSTTPETWSKRII
jgi:UDP-glucose 4-epimerase